MRKEEPRMNLVACPASLSAWVDETHGYWQEVSPLADMMEAIRSLVHMFLAGADSSSRARAQLMCMRNTSSQPTRSRPTFYERGNSIISLEVRQSSSHHLLTRGPPNEVHGDECAASVPCEVRQKGCVRLRTSCRYVVGWARCLSTPNCGRREFSRSGIECRGVETQGNRGAIEDAPLRRGNR